MSISYTKSQRHAIALAWSHLDSHAMPSGLRTRLNDAVSIERKGHFSDRIGATQARAQVIAWFLDGFLSPDMKACCIAGVRISCAVATLAGIDIRAHHSERLSSLGYAAVEAAARAHQAALDTDRARVVQVSA
jgi:hypothetical protein